MDNSSDSNEPDRELHEQRDDTTDRQDFKTVEPSAAASSQTVPARQRRRTWRMALLAAVGLVLLAAVLAAGYMLGSRKPSASTTTASQSERSSQTTTVADGRLHLDLAKDYGDTYKDGILPVGDKKYTTDGAKQGYVYVCTQYARNLESNTIGGAGSRGPWFSSDGTTYDISKKAQVGGSVHWDSSFSNTVSGGTRTITSNDLPNHVTGIFPVRSSDIAYRYDKNPNSITSQDYTYSLPADPTYGSPNCMGGQVGVMLTGAAIFNAFDADGRDGGAWEVQDDCSGHPEKTGEYHYHTLSSCIKDTGVQTVIGFALDGFALTGPKVGEGNVLTTSDLDECHGITSEIMLDGKKVTRYHYVMTEDFPYSVSCFRGQAIQPPGLPQRNQQPPRQ